MRKQFIRKIADVFLQYVREPLGSRGFSPKRELCFRYYILLYRLVLKEIGFDEPLAKLPDGFCDRAVCDAVYTSYPFFCNMEEWRERQKVCGLFMKIPMVFDTARLESTYDGCAVDEYAAMCAYDNDSVGFLEVVKNVMEDEYGFSKPEIEQAKAENFSEEEFRKACEAFRNGVDTYCSKFKIETMQLFAYCAASVWSVMNEDMLTNPEDCIAYMEMSVDTSQTEAEDTGRVADLLQGKIWTWGRCCDIRLHMGEYEAFFAAMVDANHAEAFSFLLAKLLAEGENGAEELRRKGEEWIRKQA